MENQVVFCDTNPFIDLPMDIKEFSNQLGCEKYYIIRQELNKCMMYFDRCDRCESWQDSVHNLYISLYHLEKMEETLYSSDLSEELLHQTKIVSKIQFLKLAIFATIDEFEDEFYG